MKIMLVEDEEMLSSIITKGLTKLGFAVDPVYDGDDALYHYSVNQYDLIILDLNLPSVDGMEVLNTIRKQDNDSKILILSARSEIDDRVSGLNEGANDYLTKPFDFSELVARINNLLRRNFTQSPSVVQCGALTVHMLSKQAKVNGVAVPLTNKEYAILEYLVLHRDAVISSEELIEHVWNSEADLFSNSLKYHIHSLKKKLRAGNAGEELIANIRGRGYQIKGE